ncbi:hypothetical protein J19TS2_37500 [Cohnella xylanilytica]|uniref:GNAT family N-acetyltransferase n=1 Tax=Cohnella xylanilytica TaxID=557555 RepID=A0A841TXA0_9BACL|nr:GNAT family N-acetyltransferase [Cohnella xylanilytica]MBB6690571.1 GNAT family N-acetyltransferase [Cohnella xylanilytica]GIO14195.1 hypothetical protein J19TS2_37500 [Cohnella xylanilytica]
MPTPSSIKTARLLLVFKLILILFVVAIALLVLVIPDSLSSGWSGYREKTIDSMFGLKPEEYKAGHFGIVLLNFAPAILMIALNIYFINKRKRLVSIVLSLLVLWFSFNNMIQLVLSFACIVLLMTRSSRAYFLEGAGALSPAAAEKADDDDSPDGESDEPDERENPDDEESGSDSDSEKPASSAESKGGEGSGEEPPKETKVAARSAASASGSSGRSRPKPSADPVVEIREAGAEDAEVVHFLMLEAFEEYRAAVPPSSALDETAESVREALESGGESAVILYEDDIPAAMVRYRFEEDAIYFFRLSVAPPRRKRGYARQLVEWVERKGRSQGLSFSRCKVRQSVHRNLVLYENMGYEIKDQELVVRPEGSVKALLLEKNLGPQ